MFCNQFGKQFATEGLQTAIVRYNHGRGVSKTSVHLFRHTFAKKWILSGGDIFRLQKLLGHSSLEIVKEYVNIFGADLKAQYDTFAYLTEQRGLSQLLIKNLIADRLLFQEARTNNAVFPIYEDHKMVGAEVVGTLANERFKHIKTGSKYGCGYNLTFGKETAYALFFESAIDFLSFIDLSRMRGKDLAGCRLTSIMGLKPNIVDHTLQALPRAHGLFYA